MTHKTRVLLNLFVALLMFSGVASAVVLEPETEGVPELYVPAGAAFVDTVTQTRSSSGTPTTQWTADLTSSVYRLPSGMLEFWYRVHNVSQAPNYLGFIDDLSVNGYSGYLVEVYQIDSNTLPDVTNEVAAVNALRGPLGETVTFDFRTPGLITPGRESYTIIIRTDTPNYQISTAKLSDGTSVDNIPIFAPAAVPEPGTYGALLAAGMGVLLWVRQRRTA